jgi:putative restriction endonuclease
MTCDEARKRFAALNVWRRGGERAPHKPLLLLLTLARVARGGDRLVPFAEVEDPLRKLLIEFGPPRTTQNPHLPYWHLQSDGVWEVVGLPGGDDRAPGDTPLVSELRSPDVRAGLTEELDRTIRADPDCLRDLARRLLDSSFPESLHDEIAGAVGLELTDRTLRRDPRFRERILVAYGYSCAVCGYDLRLHHAPVALEAAHIKWHQAGGPSTEENGLALCTMHHKLFDRGAMTLGPERRVVVSPWVNGSTGLEDWLMRFDGQPLRDPRGPHQIPLEEYVRWHVRQVFKGPGAPLEVLDPDPTPTDRR